jgi:hypothetical protein
LFSLVAVHSREGQSIENVRDNDLETIIIRRSYFSFKLLPRHSSKMLLKRASEFAIMRVGDSHHFLFKGERSHGYLSIQVIEFKE